MAMSKKDFELIADVLSSGLVDGCEDAFEDTARVLICDMASALEANYPNFKKDVFFKRTGLR
jgi:hypothetical protein